MSATSILELKLFVEMSNSHVNCVLSRVRCLATVDSNLTQIQNLLVVRDVSSLRNGLRKTDLQIKRALLNISQKIYITPVEYMAT